MTAVKRQPSGSSERVRVLVADDDERSLDSLVALLAGEGLSTEPFLGGLEALARLGLIDPRARRPREERVAARIDFLVLDYNMPDLSGIEVLRRIRSGFGMPLPAILVSGESNDELERLWLAAGGFALLPKPVVPDDFRLEVRRLLRRFFGTGPTLD
jgi:CheY-like chemotaxis protein